MLLQKLGPPWLQLPHMKYQSPGGKCGLIIAWISRISKVIPLITHSNTSPLLLILTLPKMFQDFCHTSPLLLLPLPWLWLNPSPFLASRIHCQVGSSQFSFEGIVTDLSHPCPESQPRPNGTETHLNASGHVHWAGAVRGEGDSWKLNCIRISGGFGQWGRNIHRLLRTSGENQERRTERLLSTSYFRP